MRATSVDHVISSLPIQDSVYFHCPGMGPWPSIPAISSDLRGSGSSFQEFVT